MDSDSNGASPEGQQALFALVVYIPEPLGRFLDELRRELVPGCNPHAHVSVLPPRTLAVPWQDACEEARRRAGEFKPFLIEALEIQVFHRTKVLYIEIGAGAGELRRMHKAMSSGLLTFKEPFRYHPHITIAQDIPEGRVEQLYQLACERWEGYRGDRAFRAAKAMFVHSNDRSCWTDLAELPLGTHERFKLLPGEPEPARM